MTLSLVVPVYRNEDSLPELLRVVAELSSTVAGGVEGVFVVDGSPDASAQLLARELPAQPFASRLLCLSRNFGSFAAIRAGLAAGDGDLYAVMAADLQEPPSLVAGMAQRLQSGECDLVIGTRATRADAWHQRLPSRFFWGLYRRLVQRDVPSGGVDVFACTREVRDCLLRLEESNSSLVGLLFWIGFRRAEVRYDRLPRRHGRSAWSLRRKVRYLLDSTFSFSDLPVRILSLAGLGGMLLAALLAVVVLWARWTSGRVVPGYTALALIIMFFGGLNCFGLGILGEYVWRAFENTKRRPLQIVAQERRFPGSPPK